VHGLARDRIDFGFGQMDVFAIDVEDDTRRTSRDQLQ
jgi:hypothetical protein